MFTFFCLLLTRQCFGVLILAREHRVPTVPYALLFLSLIISVLANVVGIALDVLPNMSHYNTPAPIQAALEASDWLFTNWTILLIFSSVIAVLLQREAAIYAATGGKVGRRNDGIPVACTALTAILFVLGTAGPALRFDTSRKYQIAQNEIKFECNTNASLEKAAALELWHDRRSHMGEDLSGMFDSFVVLAGIEVIVSTVLLWRAVGAAGIKDKVRNLLWLSPSSRLTPQSLSR
jgi:hypothetical protein